MNYLHKHRTFENTQELNYHVKQHTNRKYNDMTETHRQVLQVIAQYSVKYSGASHIKMDTIAEAIGRTRLTVLRAIKALEELRVIDRIRTTRRVRGGKGANMYVILPFEEVEDTSEKIHREEAEEPTRARNSEPIIEKESAYSLSSKDIKRTYTETSYSTAYARFIEAFEPFISVGSSSGRRLISRLYGVFLANTRKIKHVHTEDELSDVATRAIHATMHASKRKRLDSIIGYFTGVVRKMLNGLLADIMRDFALNAPAGDWSTPLEGV